MGNELTELAFLIRRPTAAEKRACRMLLPRATSAGQRSQTHVAVSRDDERVIGAAALGPDAALDSASGGRGRRWLVDLRVIVPARRRGVGRALMSRVVEQAAGHGIPALYAWEWVEPEGDAARAWAALGFSPCQRQMEYEADLTRSHEVLLPLYTRVREEGWIPPSARIVPLADADHDAVARLHLRCLGGTRSLLLPMLRGSAADAYDPACSRVLLVDGRVVGFTLGRVHPGGAVADVDANVVDPTLRLGWANLWLKFEAASVLLARGVQRIRYATLQQHKDTHRISRQVDARLLRTVVQMRRDLAPPATGVAGPESAPPAAGGAGAGG